MTVPAFSVDAGHSAVFPFNALVGQARLRQALLLAAVDERIGGVLISGPRGNAKSTAARALAGLLPGAPFVNLPLAASLEQLVGTLSLEDALRDGEVRLAPGLVARAHGGVLYVDEVNLLPDALVDALLDVAASGTNTVERDGISRQHAARFVLVGTMNPEEGDLRPQLLDRFGLFVSLDNPGDPVQRQAIVRTRLAFDHDPDTVFREHEVEQARLQARVAAARASLPGLAWHDDVLQRAADLALAAGVDGVRADLVMLRAARAQAALEGRDRICVEHVDAVAEFALAHRRGGDGHTDNARPPVGGAHGNERLHSPQSRSANAPSAHTEPEGDWGALPPQPQTMARVRSAGALIPKKA